jgi:hypothetical protein
MASSPLKGPIPIVLQWQLNFSMSFRMTCTGPSLLGGGLPFQADCVPYDLAILMSPGIPLCSPLQA